jgi:hypothetical protein
VHNVAALLVFLWTVDGLLGYAGGIYLISAAFEACSSLE